MEPMTVDQLRKHAHALGFTPQDQVRWLAPAQLVRTGIKVGLSTLFADYADRREVQASLPKPPIVVRPGADGGLWLDFVADLGDGFDATYTVASLIAADRLEVSSPDGQSFSLPRGEILVLGGDEVYPTASAVGYEDRTKGPYRAALPAASVTGHHAGPTLLALPGNHDWYDGLTAFLRVFAQRRPIGGWRTEQTRSYFAVQLPDRWWLVGVDTQFGTYIDFPQIEYFREHLSAKLQPGDGVILCAPAPTWVEATRPDTPDAFNSLHWFERHVVENHEEDDGTVTPTGASVRLWLTGDLHHYARYAEDDVADDAVPGASRQLVTCGLGGGFLTETHRLPDSLELPPSASRMTGKGIPARFSLRSRWPSVELSRRLVPRMAGLSRFALPLRNPGFWRLCGIVQAFAVLTLVIVLGVELGEDPVTALRSAGAAEAGRLGLQVLAWFVVVIAFVTVVPVVRGARPSFPYETFLAVGVQLVVAVATLAAAVSIPWPASWAPWVVLGLMLLGTALVTGLVASYAFALYMLLSRRRTVQGWQMSAQAVEDYKGFLRLRFDPDGAVTLYPVVVEKICHTWGLTGDRPVPLPGLPQAVLAEPPVRVARTVAPTAPSPQR